MIVKIGVTTQATFAIANNQFKQFQHIHDLYLNLTPFLREGLTLPHWRDKEIRTQGGEMTGTLSPHWELKPEPCYQPALQVPFLLSPSLLGPQTPSSQRNEASPSFPGCPMLPARWCWVLCQAPRHTPHKEAARVGAHRKLLWGLCQLSCRIPQAATLSWSCSSARQPKQLCSPLLQTVQLLLW